MKMKLHVISRILGTFFLVVCSGGKVDTSFEFVNSYRGEGKTSSAAIGTAINKLSLKVIPPSNAKVIKNTPTQNGITINNNSSQNSGSNQDIGNDVESQYCLYGTATWKTNAYKTNLTPSFPLINAEVDIYSDVDTILASTRTDDNGKYKFRFDGSSEIWKNLSDYKLMFVLRSEEAIVYTRHLNNNNTVKGRDYFAFKDVEKKLQNTNAYIAGKGNISIVKDANDDTKSIELNQECTDDKDDKGYKHYSGAYCQLYTMVQLYARHANELNSGFSNEKFPTCNIFYPCKVDSNTEDNRTEYQYGANYLYSDHVINVPLSVENPSNPNMYSYNSWDVIGHEYGHHLANQIGFKHANGTHYFNIDDCLQSLKNQKNGEYGNATIDPVTYGKTLAWDESWPTYFSIAAQKSFPALFRDNIYSLGDDDYDAYNIPFTDRYSLSVGYDSSVNGSDSNELSIQRFLYQLWNKNIGTAEEYCSEKELWMDVIYANDAYDGLENFQQFYRYIYSHHPTEQLTKLASEQQIAASNASIDGQNVETSVCPTFTWDGKVNLTYQGKTIEKYGYQIHIYNDAQCSDKLMTLKGNGFIYGNSYTLSEGESYFLSGEKAYVKIEKHTLRQSGDSWVKISSYDSQVIEIHFPIYKK